MSNHNFEIPECYGTLSVSISTETSRVVPIIPKFQSEITTWAEFTKEVSSNCFCDPCPLTCSRVYKEIIWEGWKNWTLKRGMFLEISILTSGLMREASRWSLGELVRGPQRQSKWKLGHIWETERVRAKAACRRVESYSWKAIVSLQKENFRQGPHERDDSRVERNYGPFPREVWSSSGSPLPLVYPPVQPTPLV